MTDIFSLERKEEIILPERRQTSLKFPLEETIWFENGQEVGDLVSISLDPEISILDEDEFVVLKGTLDLRGEYYQSSESDTVEDALSGTPVQGVEPRADGISEFSHRFPVDITIPKRRIETTDEIEIEIHSFDYVLTENNRLQVLAEVSIHGIYEEFEDAEMEIPENDIDLSKEEVDRTDNVHNEESYEEETIVRDDALELNVEEDPDDREEVKIALFEQKDLSIVEQESEDETVEEDLFEPFHVEARALPEEEKEENETQGQSFAFIPQLPKVTMEPERLEQDEPNYKSVESSSYMEMYNDESSSLQYESSSSLVKMEEEPKKKKKKDKYESISFADFFARKEEETTSKMRICLVQQGDSIQSLADKYELSVQQILRANRLDASHEVYEGQVLYIPAKPVRVLRKE